MNGNGCSSGFQGVTECDTVQIIEPQNDLLVDTAGTTSDLDERGSLPLSPGQINAVVVFNVPKLNANYSFEYLYVDAMGDTNPGVINVVPTVRAVEGFAVVFAGVPLNDLCVLHWRVVVVTTSSLLLVDAPEDLYLQMPQAPTMAILFANPRSNTNYGFTELRVENLTQPANQQTPIHVQVVAKTLSGFSIGVNPTPRSDFYFLKVRTP